MTDGEPGDKFDKQEGNKAIADAFGQNDAVEDESTTEEIQPNALDVIINPDAKRVGIVFERATDAVEFDPEQAIMLGQSLIDAAEELGVTKNVILTSH